MALAQRSRYAMSFGREVYSRLASVDVALGETLMLILSRRAGEELRIGDDIVITILSIKGQQVRIGITAPRNIQVDRAEIFLRKQAEKGP